MTVVTQTATSTRDKILQRVINLRARADDDASSEAEMNTALSMAMKLMDSYNIEEAELALAESEGRIELEIVQKVADTSMLKGSKQKHKVLNTLSSIAKFTETKVVVSTWSGDITFTGHRPDAELANYLVAVVKESLDREYDRYRRNTPAVGYGAKNSFQLAMATRVSQRLSDMANERDQDRRTAKKEAQKLKIENAATASSTALVISEIAEQKAREVNDQFRKAYPKLGNIKTSYRYSNGTAHGAGRAAGDRVNLGRSIGSSTRKTLA